MEETPPVVAASHKSPPMAFLTTSNDSLWSPLGSTADITFVTSPPNTHDFDDILPENDMQAQIHKQAEALRLQHKAFDAERESWDLEKVRLYRRIGALEALLKATANGQSPARSPVVSPHSGNTYTSSQPRSSSTSVGASRLASIAEIESPSPKAENQRPSNSIKRGSAPTHIQLPSPPKSSSFEPSSLSAEVLGVNDSSEAPCSPPQMRATLSPPPLANRQHAGHTPLRGPPSPTLSGVLERLDTPTRSNTALNETLSDSTDEDRPLKGPLMMPELPTNPGEENFTMSMLDAKLQDLIEHPEDSQPLAMRSQSPTFPVDPAGHTDDHCMSGSQPRSQLESIESKIPSPPPASGDAMDCGGIKLRKKASCNFGAPFGQINPTWKQH